MGLGKSLPRCVTNSLRLVTGARLPCEPCKPRDPGETSNLSVIPAESTRFPRIPGETSNAGVIPGKAKRIPRNPGDSVEGVRGRGRRRVPSGGGPRVDQRLLDADDVHRLP